MCGDLERRAAVWAHDDLRARGHEAWVETHWVRPQRAASLALGCALAATGGLVAVVAPVAGLAIAALAALSVLGRRRPHRVAPLPAAAPGDAGRARRAGRRRDRRPADHARTDVPRAGLARRLARVPGGLVWLGAAALAVVAAAAARVAGEDGTLLGALQLVPTVVLLVAAAVALDSRRAGRRRAPWDAALPAALALHDELVATPAPGIAAGLLLAGPDALRATCGASGRPARTALLHVAATVTCAAATRSGAARPRRPAWRCGAAARAGCRRRSCRPTPPRGSRAGSLRFCAKASSTK